MNADGFQFKGFQVVNGYPNNNLHIKQHIFSFITWPFAYSNLTRELVGMVPQAATTTPDSDSDSDSEKEEQQTSTSTFQIEQSIAQSATVAANTITRFPLSFGRSIERINEKSYQNIAQFHKISPSVFLSPDSNEEEEDEEDEEE